MDAEVDHKADQLAGREDGEGKLAKTEQEGLELQGMGTAGESRVSPSFCFVSLWFFEKGE